VQVCLIIPPQQNSVTDLPSLDIAYMASALEQHNHQVRISDWTVGLDLSLEKRIAQICQTHPDVIGLTAMTHSYFAAQQIVARLRERTECPIILAGPHATALPRQSLLENPGLDFVIRGEGEKAIVKLLTTLEQEDINLENVPGLLFRRSAEIVENSAQDPTPPNTFFPAFHLFELGQYALKGLNGSLILPLLVSRRDGIRQGEWRQRQVDSVIEELNYNRTHYNVHAAWFICHPFTADDPWAQQFTEAIIDKGLDFQWRCQADVTHVTPRFLGQMRQAGCRKVDYFFQFNGVSLDNEQLNKLRSNVSWTAKLDIKSKGLFKIGRPGDNEDKVRALVEFVSTLELDEIETQYYYPRPGSPEWPLVQERYIATGQTASIYQTFYENDLSRNTGPSWLNVSDIPHTRLVTLAREGQWIISEAKRRKKYELHFGQSLGTLVWRLSQRRWIRSIGRRIIDLGVLRTLRTADENGRSDSILLTASSTQSKTKVKTLNNPETSRIGR